ncbi:unnamed protein product, partial [Sphenostylis stenocarpa]
VDLNDEMVKIVCGMNKITNTTLHKMGFAKVDDRWISKHEEHEGVGLEEANEVDPINANDDVPMIMDMVLYVPPIDYGIFFVPDQTNDVIEVGHQASWINDL